MDDDDLAMAMLQADSLNNSALSDEQRVNYQNRAQRYAKQLGSGLTHVTHYVYKLLISIVS